jgi:hypothetical protein
MVAVNHPPRPWPSSNLDTRAMHYHHYTMSRQMAEQHQLVNTF